MDWTKYAPLPLSERKFRRVAVLKGGLSAEREVSLVSGAQCAAALRAVGYDVVEIDAGRDLPAQLSQAAADAVFNALHGNFGEDGVVQGLLEWMGLPYTHSGVQSSAIAMDKHRSKALFSAAGLPVAEHIVASAADVSASHLLEPPYVAKPVAEGSSVDVYIIAEGANSPPQLAEGDHRSWMVERYLKGRELTVSVLDDAPVAVTEIISPGWYDYAAKYAAGGSRHILPADIPAEATEAALQAAALAHKALGCRGLSRSDFRYDESASDAAYGKLTILELNSQPGMTPTSLSPEQAQHVGVSFEALVAWLVEDASVGR
ncbi:MAG: D-alanine--D-alanine ligase [Neomegalonema sp.]|nr:D-alanine--D-alanine ligase [Neomegalonema sp.]